MFALLALAAAQPARLPVEALRDGPPPPPLQRARPPQPYQSYLRPGDYPEAALRARAEGRVAFQLAAQPDGRVYFCRIMHSSGSPALDEATCRILRARVRYGPALDEEGRAVAVTGLGAVRWRLPRR